MPKIRMSERLITMAGGCDGLIVPETVKKRKANGELDVLVPEEQVAVSTEVAERLKKEMGWRIDVVD